MPRLTTLLVVVSALLGYACRSGIRGPVATRPALEPPAADSTRWVGVSPGGGLVYNDGNCRQDVEFELTRTGDVVNGWIRSARVLDGDCQSILSQEQGSTELAPSPIVGAFKEQTVSVAIFQMRTRNGVPNRVTAFLVTGSIAENDLSATGRVLGPRTWVDSNRNGVPECDLEVDAKNGECGRSDGPAHSVSLRARRVQ
jgi:hypothetical protein